MRNSFTDGSQFDNYDRLRLLYANVEKPVKELHQWVIIYDDPYPKTVSRIKCRCNSNPTMHEIVTETNTKVCTECHKLSTNNTVH
jgi:hypothetical protein